MIRSAKRSAGAALVVAIALVCACESDGESSGDSAEDALGESGAALTEPDPPVLTPCPPGWREVEPLGPNEPATCDAWPEAGPQTCPDGEAHFVGEPGCAPIGEPCGDGEWATNLPVDRPVVYVRAAADPGGRGTVEEPFDSIEDAIDSAPAGAVIALGKGSYDEVFEVPAGLALWGACVTETVLTTSELFEPPEGLDPVGAILVTGRDVEIRNLQLGGTWPGIGVAEGGSARIQDVIIANASFGGVLVRGRAALDTVVIRDTQEVEANHTGVGFGLVANGAEGIELDRVVIDGNGLYGIGASFTASVEIRDTVVRDTRELGPLAYFDGTGLLAAAIEDLSVSQSSFEGNASIGLLIAEGATDMRAHLSDLVVRGPEVPDLSTLSGGLVVMTTEGPLANVGVERVLVEQTHHWGIVAFCADLGLTDVIVRDVVGYGGVTQEEYGGFGLVATSGADVELSRVAILRSMGVGLWTTTDSECLWRDTAEVTGTDVLIADTLEQTCVADDCGEVSSFGFAAVVTGDGATTTLTRFLLSHSSLAGMQLAEGGAADLHLGGVADNPIGVNVQTPRFDVERLQDRVTFVDNGRNFDSQELPVPRLDGAGLFE
jgi:hypothetical protein